MNRKRGCADEKEMVKSTGSGRRYGNDDDAAVDAPDPYAVYQQFIDLGARMLQTDRPELVLEFLRSKGLHD